MSKITYYSPEGVTATEAFVMPGILAGTEKTLDGRPGDLEQRGRWAANDLGIGAILVQRATGEDVSLRPRTFILGLPTAYEPAEYAQRAADDARTIDKIREQHGLKDGRLGAMLASAGVYGLELAEAGLPLTNIAIYDAHMVKGYGKSQFRGAAHAIYDWLKHQLGTELRRPEHARNQHPLPYPVKGEVSAVQDIALHAKIWQTQRASTSIVRLARGQLCPDATTRYTLPGKTFTLDPEIARKRATLLNETARVAGTDFRAIFVPHLYHSATDDPAFCSQLLEAAMPKAA